MADYQTLASIVKPQMMPSAPIGGGFGAGWMYGEDKNRFDEMVNKAGGLAQLNAMLEAQQASETMAGAPGRMDAIGLSNLKSKSALDLYKNGGQDLDKVKQEEETLNTIAPYLNTLAKAESDKEARDAYDELVKVVPKFGSIPFEQMRKKAQVRFGGQVNTPKQEQDMAKESQKIKGRMGIAELAAKNRIDVQKLKDQTSKQLAEAKARQTSGKPLTSSQQEALAVDAMYKDDPEGQLKYWLTKAASSRLPADQAKAATGQAFGLPTETPEAVSPPAPSGNRIPMGGPKTATPDLTAPVDYKIGSIWEDKAGKKKIVDVGRDKATGKVVAIKLEDGTTIKVNQ